MFRGKVLVDGVRSMNFVTVRNGRFTPHFHLLRKEGAKLLLLLLCPRTASANVGPLPWRCQVWVRRETYAPQPQEQRTF